MAIQETSKTGLALAVRTAGSQVAFAKLIGTRQSTVRGWLVAGKELPAELVLSVERQLGISRHDLRPDLYPREEAPLEPSAPEPARHSAEQPPEPASCPDASPNADEDSGGPTPPSKAIGRASADAANGTAGAASGSNEELAA